MFIAARRALLVALRDRRPGSSGWLNNARPSAYLRALGLCALLSSSTVSALRHAWCPRFGGHGAARRDLEYSRLVFETILLFWIVRRKGLGLHVLAFGKKLRILVHTSSTPPTGSGLWPGRITQALKAPTTAVQPPSIERLAPGDLRPRRSAAQKNSAQYLRRPAPKYHEFPWSAVRPSSTS